MISTCVTCPVGTLFDTFFDFPIIVFLSLTKNNTKLQKPGKIVDAFVLNMDSVV